MARRLADAAADFGRLLHRAGIERADELRAIAEQAASALVKRTPEPEPLLELRRRWYRSVVRLEPDYGVYADDLYLAEAFGCWWSYSRRYVYEIERQRKGGSVLERLGPVGSVADLGCGIGESTAALADLFHDAAVYGTNVEPSSQWTIASLRAESSRYTLATEPAPADLVFASEYFEHFAAPVRHLREVLEAARPRIVATANAFSAESCGHFPVYEIDGRLRSPADTSRAFGAELRRHGFRRLDVAIWNNRPTVWIR